MVHGPDETARSRSPPCRRASTRWWRGTSASASGASAYDSRRRDHQVTFTLPVLEPGRDERRGWSRARCWRRFSPSRWSSARCSCCSAWTCASACASRSPTTSRGAAGVHAGRSRRQQEMRGDGVDARREPDAQSRARHLATERARPTSGPAASCSPRCSTRPTRSPARVGADVLAVADAHGAIVASAGRWRRRGRAASSIATPPTPGRRRDRAVVATAAACIRGLACRCCSARRRSGRSSSAPRSTRVTRGNWRTCRAAMRDPVDDRGAATTLRGRRRAISHAYRSVTPDVRAR